MFIKQALKQTDETDRFSHTTHDTHNLEQLTERVCRQCGLSPQAVQSASKQRHLKQAKSMVCYLPIRILKPKGIAVAGHLTISKSAVSKLVSGFQPDKTYTAFIANHFYC